MKTAFIICGEISEPIVEMANNKLSAETDIFGINNLSTQYLTEHAFVDNAESYKYITDLQKQNVSNIKGTFPMRMIVSQPFMGGEKLHVSEYYHSIRYNSNEDVNKLVDLTDGEIRYHLLQAVKKNIHFYFPSYHSIMSLMIFYCVWHEYRCIKIAGFNIKPLSQEHKAKADYANTHINRLLEFVKELGIEIQIIQ